MKKFLKIYVRFKPSRTLKSESEKTIRVLALTSKRYSQIYN